MNYSMLIIVPFECEDIHNDKFLISQKSHDAA